MRVLCQIFLDREQFDGERAARIELAALIDATLGLPQSRCRGLADGGDDSASAASSAPASTTRVTSPAVLASSAVSLRPVNIKSFASRLPSTRASRWVAPTVPHSASGVEKVASGVAMMKSHAAAISLPEPIAAPCTTAMVGIGSASIAL